MIQRFYKNLLVNITFGILLAACAVSIHAQTTAFTYQGRLTDNSMSPTNSYDMQFRLYDLPTVGSGVQQGGTVTRSAVQVANGVFTVQLDFGDAYYTASRLYLEVSVRPAGGTTYTPLNPRQQLTSAPMAVQARNALNAANADNAFSADRLDGTPASDFAMINDLRFTDSRNPTAGSGFYIQNNPAATTQTGSFNVSGNGIVGGTLTTFNAAVSNNLSVQGNVTSQGIFTGSGSSITALNADNITGGTLAESRLSPNIPRLNAANFFNTTQTAPIFNATTHISISGSRVLSIAGTRNLFAGKSAGLNSTGGSNTFVGDSAGIKTSGDGNSFFGTSAGFANTTGRSNAFFGDLSGLDNTTGILNTFIGAGAGGSNTDGKSNTFVGAVAGVSNETAEGNAYLGASAGFTNETGNSNSFVGALSGYLTTDGGNSFFGFKAGYANTTGSYNTTLGIAADVGSGNLTYATAVGAGSVVSNSSTIALGRENGSDKVVVYGLGAAGSTSLCRNALNQISTCSPGSFAENRETVNALRAENARTIEQLKRQQIIIDELNQTICAIKPDAAICQPEEK